MSDCNTFHTDYGATSKFRTRLEAVQDTTPRCVICAETEAGHKLLTPTIAEKTAALRDPTLEIQNPTSALDDLDPRDSRYGRLKPSEPEIGKPHEPTVGEIEERRRFDAD